MLFKHHCISGVYANTCKWGQWDSLSWPQHSLGHQGEGFSAHGRTGHQFDHHMFRSSLEMRPRHLLQHWGQGGHIPSLSARVPTCCVQDVSPVHHKQQHMGLTFALQKGWGRVEKETLWKKWGCIAAAYVLNTEYTVRVFIMILPLYPPVPQCCSEGHSVVLPAGRDPLYWVSKL